MHLDLLRQMNFCCTNINGKANTAPSSIECYQLNFHYLESLTSVRPLKRPVLTAKIEVSFGAFEYFQFRWSI